MNMIKQNRNLDSFYISTTHSIRVCKIIIIFLTNKIQYICIILKMYIKKCSVSKKKNKPQNVIMQIIDLHLRPE